MATKLNTLFFLHHHHHHHHHHPHNTLHFLRQTPILSFSTTTPTKQILSNSTLSYGPSLHQNGIINPPIQLTPNKLDETSFTRIFHLSALRLPSHLCSTLETRIRGHLLNWPRVKNIARVPNDEIDPTINSLLPNYLINDDNDNNNVALERRIYGKGEGDGEGVGDDCGVLYRDELAKSFDSRGFTEFKNLGKISRPSGDGKGKWRRKGVGRSKDEFAVVEVVEEEGGESEELGGLMGDGVRRRRKWSGSTRLLLLDEKYRGLGIEELPEAIKVMALKRQLLEVIKMALKEQDGQSVESAFEVVRCKLTLFYEYWQLSEILEALLPEGMIVPSTFETVGHIAHLNLRDEHLQYKYLIAKVVLDKNKPKIQTVVNKVDTINNDYRTMQLEVLAGNNSLVTTVVENGLRFHFDLATVYWSSRLATERQRLLSCFTRSDIVCDVFAGVGPLAISAAKKVKHVYANDLNPNAVEYLERNSVLNRLERKIEVFNMDGRRFIDMIFANQRAKPITQVVMNLPKDAAEFLDVFKGIFSGRRMDNEDMPMPRIHVYGFSKAEDPEFDFHERIRIALAEAAFDVDMHKVRLVAPGKWMLCASFILPEKVAYSKTGFNSLR